MYRSAALVVLSLTAFSASAYGAGETTPSGAAPTAGLDMVMPSAEKAEAFLPPTATGAARRPSILPVLYASFAVLQVFDGYSTTAALARGAREANPMMRGVAGNSAAFWAVKVTSTAGSIWLADRLWKTNRTGAIVTMVVINGMMASVAARNASVLKALP